MAIGREPERPDPGWNPLAPEKTTVMLAVPSAEYASLQKERDDLRSENAILRSENAQLRSLPFPLPASVEDDDFAVGPC